jgi:hypothetical protein
MTTRIRPSVKEEILHQAELLSTTFPRKERKQFKKDHIKNAVELNERISARLDRFLKDSTPLTLAYANQMPGMAQHYLSNQREFLTNLTQALIDQLTKVESAPVRALMVNFVRDILKYCHEAITAKETDSFKRKGRILQ